MQAVSLAWDSCRWRPGHATDDTAEDSWVMSSTMFVLRYRSHDNKRDLSHAPHNSSSHQAPPFAHEFAIVIIVHVFYMEEHLMRDHHHHHHHHHHLSLNREDCWGTTDDFATSFLHFSLFSAALWDLPNSRPVYSLMLSSHLFLCLPWWEIRPLLAHSGQVPSLLGTEMNLQMPTSEYSQNNHTLFQIQFQVQHQHTIPGLPSWFPSANVGALFEQEFAWFHRTLCSEIARKQ